MYDSYGDGWNGNFLTINSSNGTQFWSTTLWPIPNGHFATESFCIPDNDCYSISVNGGIWQNEISWELVDTNGIIVRSGGAPYSGGMCLPFIYGCKDPLALNFGVHGEVFPVLVLAPQNMEVILPALRFYVVIKG